MDPYQRLGAIFFSSPASGIFEKPEENLGLIFLREVLDGRDRTSRILNRWGERKMKIMNESIQRKSAMAFRFKDTKTGFPMRVRCVAFLVVLVFTNLTTVAFSQSPSCPGIHVKVLNIRNSTGTVDCALFDSPDGFPIEVLLSAKNTMVIKVRHTQARCDFEDIPPGTYALAVIHDENMNGKLDTDSRGIPTEGYGFSNDVRELLGPPSFYAARFPYDGKNLDLTIRLNY